MKILLQKVLKAEVHIKNLCYSNIQKGLLIYFCAEKGDTFNKCQKLAKKTCGIRIFEDSEKMRNLSVNDMNGELLIVSQFTLSAQCKKGNKPDYFLAEKHEKAKELYFLFIKECEIYSKNKIKTGVFGENMQIMSINDGPMTFILD